jgi:carboxylate-amine ligase
VSFGVEEEFLVVDPVTYVPVPVSANVLRSVPAGLVPGELKPELLTAQLESATGVCWTLAALRRQLDEARQALARAAAACGARVMAAGYAPVVDGATTLTVSDDERYRAIEHLYQGIATDYPACGCHVHVGVPDREAAVQVVNRLRPWLPVLLALSANSAFARGRDTGYASWRAAAQARFPGYGVPPVCRDAAAYDHALARQVRLGTTVDTRMTFWCARPSEHVPTVEVRVADVAATVDEAVLQAGLSRALVVRALHDVAAGRPVPRTDPEVATAAMWTAARYGHAGPGIDPFREEEVPATVLLDNLLAYVDEALRELGDRDEVHRLAAQVVTTGTGADRQRDAAVGGGLPAVGRLVTLPADDAPDTGQEAT